MQWRFMAHTTLLRRGRRRHLWNVALINRNKERLNFYIPYAFFFVPFFYIFSTLALVVAVKFPL
jgi:hypothetical protein